MRNDIIEELKKIIEDDDCSRNERILALCLMDIYTDIKFLRKINYIQITLISSIIMALVILATSI